MNNYLNLMKDERAKVKPKYKIGDIIVYPERYDKDEESVLSLNQSKIIESYSFLDISDKKDKLVWFYITEESEKLGEDTIGEKDILYKL